MGEDPGGGVVFLAYKRLVGRSEEEEVGTQVKHKN